MKKTLLPRLLATSAAVLALISAPSAFAFTDGTLSGTGANMSWDLNSNWVSPTFATGEENQ